MLYNFLNVCTWRAVFKIVKGRRLEDQCCVRPYGPTIWTLHWHSSLPQTNTRLPSEALPGGGKLVVLLISKSVWCMFPFMSDWSVPQRMPPGMSLVMAVSCWWPRPRLSLSWCSSSPWVYSCAAGPSRPRPARDPCKKWLFVCYCLLLFHNNRVYVGSSNILKSLLL